MSEHTPGPWTWRMAREWDDDDTLYASDGSVVIGLYWLDPDSASLIACEKPLLAAAPELLAALQAAEYVLARNTVAERENAGILAVIRAAIRKAEGG